MFSLESWPEAFEHCKTAAEINHFLLENTSENAVFVGVPAAVRGGIAYRPLSGSRRGGLYASLLRSLDVFHQRTVVWSLCSAHAVSRQKPHLSIEDSSKIRSVHFPLGLLPESLIFVEGGAALALRN